MSPSDPHQDPAPAAPPPRAALRRGWGVADDTPVVALLGEPFASADAWTAALVVSLVRRASGQPLRLLLHPQQHRRARAQDHLDRGPDADLFIQDARLARPETVLPGCDAALLVGDPAPRAARHAVAAALPVAAPDTPAHRAALAATRARVGFAPGGQPKKLADRLMHDALALPGLGKQFVPPNVPGMTQVS